MIKTEKSKYQYWHIITKVSEYYAKINPQVKVGCCITQSCIRNNQDIDLIDLEKGKPIDGAYRVQYIGRVHRSLAIKIKTKEIKEHLEKWKLKHKELCKKLNIK